jgi:hypothetical protein
VLVPGGRELPSEGSRQSRPAEPDAAPDRRGTGPFPGSMAPRPRRRVCWSFGGKYWCFGASIFQRKKVAVNMAMRFIFFLTGFMLAGTAWGQQPGDIPKPLAADVRAGWEKAGAVTGRMDLHCVSMFRAGKEPERPGQVPAFLLGSKIHGLLAKPTPERDFGLELSIAMPNDTTLKELASLKHLRMLYVSFYYDTRAEPKGLAGLKQVERLDLNGVVVTDSVLKELAGLKQLKGLSFYQSKVTDAGLDELVRLHQLQMLNLRGTKLTYAGRKKLAGLKQLEKLYLGIGQVTDAEVEELQKASPKVRISRY